MLDIPIYVYGKKRKLFNFILCQPKIMNIYRLNLYMLFDVYFIYGKFYSLTKFKLFLGKK